MSGHGICPHCQASMQGEPIPATYLSYGDATHFGRQIGHEVRGVYDGILYWSCPDCGMAWPRWTDGGRLTDRANEFVRQHNEIVAAAKVAAS